MKAWGAAPSSSPLSYSWMRGRISYGTRTATAGTCHVRLVGDGPTTSTCDTSHELLQNVRTSVTTTLVQYNTELLMCFSPFATFHACHMPQGLGQFAEAADLAALSVPCRCPVGMRTSKQYRAFTSWLPSARCSLGTVAPNPPAIPSLCEARTAHCTWAAARTRK